MRMGAAKRVALLLLFLLASTGARADISVIDITKPLSIEGQWQFRLGDNPAWAAPQINDSQWQNTTVPAHGPENHPGYSGMLWYRLTLQLDLSQPALRDQLGALAVTLGEVMSAYEIYAGGQKLGTVGQLPPEPVAVYDKHATWAIPESAINPDGHLLLALRIWRNPAVGDHWETGPHRGEFLFGQVGDLRAHQTATALFPHLVLAILYLVVGIYHLLIARRNPVLKEFFWFGLLSLALAGYTFEASQSKFLLDIPYLWHKKIEFLFLYPLPILFGNTLLGATRSAQNMMTRGLNIVFALFFISAVLLPLDQLMRFTLMPFQALGVLWAISMAVMMSWRAYHGSRSALGVVVLMLLLAAAVVNDVILETALFGAENTLPVVAALLLFFIAVIMAERYTEILKQLELSVDERTAELVQTNCELEAAVETKGQFLANMSHEMRTPMNAILGLTHLGLQTDLNEQQRDYFSKVQNSAQGLQDIIDSIMDFSKLQDGTLKCVEEPFSPTSMTRSITQLWQTQALQAELELVVKFDQEIPEALLGDAQRIKQVLGNFISNALKYTEQGQVVITTALVGKNDKFASLRFAVSDTGPGIAQQQREQLFEAFSQADNTMTREHGGTGLGLAVAQKLVELMGGSITLESAPGEGSTFGFELTLPLTKAISNLDSDAPDLTPIRGARVLLVDDSELNLQVAGELLRQANLYVDTAEHGREAVEMVNATHYDCVLMDVQMPVMDGYTATESIRDNAEFKDLPVLAMTANAMPQDRARGTAAGMNDYIPKPIDPINLYRLLLQWIEPGQREFHEEIFTAPYTGGGAIDELPDELPGIKIKEGLARVGGNSVLYLNLLKDLCRDYADAAQRLQSMLDQTDTEGASHLAHKLRGIAYNLGADEVGAEAESIEQVLRSGETLADDANSRLAHALARIGESNATLTTLRSGGEKTAQLNADEQQALFMQLVQAVADNNPEALDLVEELLAGMVECGAVHVELAVARDALDLYDFAQAAEHLNGVSALMGTPA